MKASTLKFWYTVHRWTSLICSLNLLLLCITGLILIFHHEIDHLLGDDKHYEAPVGKSKLTLEELSLKADAASSNPGWKTQYLFFDDEEPAKAFIGVNKPGKREIEGVQFSIFNWYTGESEPFKRPQDTFTGFVLKLHKDLFLEMPGQFYMGFIGLLFVISTTSGIVLYAPFTKRLAFGILRFGRGQRTVSTDLHNFLGIATIAWTLVVGVTGCILAFEPLVLGIWQTTELKEMVARHEDAPPEKRVPIDTVMAVTEKAQPDKIPIIVFLPGTEYSGERQYTVVTKGREGLQSQLLSVVMVNAQTGELTDSRGMPWYVQALALSGPFHFGDYGGVPLKIIWVVFTLITIVVVITGLIIWWRRRKDRAGSNKELDALAEGEPA